MMLTYSLVVLDITLSKRNYLSKKRHQRITFLNSKYLLKKTADNNCSDAA